MKIHLVVVRPFGGLARGDIITDPVQIADVMKGAHASCTVRVAGPSIRED